MPAFEASEARPASVFVPDPGPTTTVFVAPETPEPEPEETPAAAEELEQAYAAGVLAGEAQAREALPIQQAEELTSAALALRDSVEALEQQASAKLVAEPRAIVELALSIAEHLLCARLGDDPDALVARVQRAIQGLPEPEPVRLEISPRDRGTLEAMREELSALASDAIEIVDHAGLAPGEFRLASGAAEVDARGAALLASVRESLAEECSDEGDAT